MTTLRTNLATIAASDVWMDYPGGRSRFYQDMLTHYGLDQSAQTDRMMDFAWDRDHADGYHAVDSTFGDLVLIVQAND